MVSARGMNLRATSAYNPPTYLWGVNLYPALTGDDLFLNWQEKGQAEYSRSALDRALELIDLTLDANRQRGRLREVARLREALVGSLRMEALNRGGRSREVRKQ